jgi:hypothetical protein
MPEVDLAQLDVVAMADPAGGKTTLKRVGARSAIAVVGSDAAEHVFLLYAWAKRTTTDKFIDQIFTVNEQWQPRQFGIEANAMQSLFADALRREARFTSRRVPFHDVHQPTAIDKPFRNRAALQSVINTGRFFMLDDQIEARNELETHPMCATFDIVDSIASAVGLLRRRPKALAASQDEVDLMRWLRRSGADERTILHYQRKVRGELPETPPRAA